MAENKIDENASRALDQDQADDVSSVISKVRDMASSRRSISDRTTTT